MGLGQYLEVQRVAHFVLFSSLSYLSRSSCNATQQDVILAATEFMVTSAASDSSGNEAITKTSLNIID